jgi:hypothetical protein
MICNIDYVDPTNDQYILKKVALKKENIKKISENDIIRDMLNNFNLADTQIESFCNIKNNKNYFIILFILFIVFYKFIM